MCCTSHFVLQKWGNGENRGLSPNVFAVSSLRLFHHSTVTKAPQIHRLKGFFLLAVIEPGTGAHLKRSIDPASRPRYQPSYPVNRRASLSASSRLIPASDSRIAGHVSTDSFERAFFHLKVEILFFEWELWELWGILEYQCVALPTLFCKNGETGKIEGYHLMYLPYLPYVCSTIPP